MYFKILKNSLKKQNKTKKTLFGHIASENKIL